MTAKARLSIEQFRRDRRGVTSIEYAIIAGAIALILVASVTLLGGNLDGLYQSAANSFP